MIILITIHNHNHYVEQNSLNLQPFFLAIGAKRATPNAGTGDHLVCEVPILLNFVGAWSGKLDKTMMDAENPLFELVSCDGSLGYMLLTNMTDVCHVLGQHQHCDRLCDWCADPTLVLGQQPGHPEFGLPAPQFQLIHVGCVGWWCCTESPNCLVDSYACDWWRRNMEPELGGIFGIDTLDECLNRHQ